MHRRTYERLVNKIRKEEEIEILRIEEESAKRCKYFYWEIENYGFKLHPDSSPVKEIEWLKLIALGKALPSCDHCSWFRSCEMEPVRGISWPEKRMVLPSPPWILWEPEESSRSDIPMAFSSRTCHHSKAVKKGYSLKNPKWKLSELDVKFSQKDIPEITKKLCPYFEPGYKLKVVGLREAQKELLEKLKKEVIVIGSWGREIILDVSSCHHEDIDILVEESKWQKVQEILRNEGFEVEEKRPEKFKAKRAMVTIDINLVENQREGEFYTLPIYSNNGYYYYGSFQLPKEGFEKREEFTVMSLELQWLTLSPGKRTKKAKKLAKLLNQKRIKELDAKLSFVGASI